MTQTKHWDSIAGRYLDVAEDVAHAMETFGEVADGAPMIWAGRAPTTATPANDNVPQPERRGDYITTYTGRFYPFDPKASEVRLSDIAHHLAAIVRYGGGTGKPYSVAEHSVHIARWLEPRYGKRTALYGLLHDAPEALSGFGDVQRPSKRGVPQIREIEDRIWLSIAAAFGLSPLFPVEVHEADNRIIADEMAQGMHECDPHYREPLGVRLEFWPPAVAELYFLDTFKKLAAVEEMAA